MERLQQLLEIHKENEEWNRRKQVFMYKDLIYGDLLGVSMGVRGVEKVPLFSSIYEDGHNYKQPNHNCPSDNDTRYFSVGDWFRYLKEFREICFYF